jgi:hypothetical protein
MHNTHSPSENGQVLVILVLVIVGLLAFTALAVDGGMIFSDRRGAQNAADAAVLAGGYRVANTLEDFNLGFNLTYENWDCTAVQPVMDIAEGEAYTQASTNSYPIIGDGSLTMSCENGEDFGSYLDKYVDTDAQIVSEVSTTFVHFAFDGPLQNTVQAISRVRPRMPLAFGYAIYAHRDDCPNSNTGGVHFTGDNLVNIQHAGIMSDACMDANGSVVVDVACSDSNDPTCDINYITDYAPSGSPVVNPPPTPQSNPLPDWALLFPEPDCSGLSNQSSPNNGGPVSPGIYNGGLTVNGGDNLVMSPGLYCLNGDFQITGGTVQGPDVDNNPDSTNPAVVTIYLMCDGCSYNSSGNADIYLSAPNYVANHNDGVAGMLIYLDKDNGGQVNLLGGLDSYYNGTVFGPHEDSQCEVGGTSSLMSIFNTQIICGTIFIHGNAQININFDQNNVYYLPARLTLEK